MPTPIATSTTIPVSLAGNQINCGSNGGNLFLKSGAGQVQVTWEWSGEPTGQQFSLQFLPLALEDDETVDWPFLGAVPYGGLTQPADHHTFTLKPSISYLGKYTVFVGNKHLDPVVIIER